MAQISVSLNVIDKIDGIITLIGDTTLAQIQAGFQERVPVLKDGLMVVSYNVNQSDSPLYELAVRTGDIFTVVTTKIDSPDGLGVTVVQPSVDVLEVSDNATRDDILSGLSKLIQKPAHQLYIGRYAADLHYTLDDFGLIKGDLISFSLLPTRVDYVLRLVPARGGYVPFQVKENTVVGGANEMVDISHLLPRRKRHLIQGAQAEFRRLNDVWHVQALPTANMPLFVDGHRIFPHRPKPLFENNVISLGSSPNEPLLQLVVQFDME